MRRGEKRGIKDGLVMGVDCHALGHLSVLSDFLTVVFECCLLTEHDGNFPEKAHEEVSPLGVDDGCAKHH